ncbi:MAG TPA: HD domain-containing phosphohydrolase [Patescibacteria group bacterium]|nr:HD domain-containing phosphohydrolase [Patescibacteria group bacterium]
MGRTKFDRVDAGAADVAVFRISGTLGFHENGMVERLAGECLKRDFNKVLFDFTNLSSLGGGVAKILREFVSRFAERGGEVGFVVTNDIILDFLQDGNRSFSTYGSLDEALRAGATAGRREPQQNVILMSYDGMEISPGPQTPGKPGVSRDGDPAYDPGIDAAGAGDAGDADSRPHSGSRDATQPAGSDHVFSEIFGDETSGAPLDWLDKPTSPFVDADTRSKNEEARISDLNKKLKRRILELKTLFSIGKDFNAIRDRKKLLDIFLLTSIAQGGVESAVFFERTGEAFVPVMSKGLDRERTESVKISPNAKMDAGDTCMVISLDDFEMDQEEREALKGIGLEHLCTFRQEGELAGLVLLGKRIAGRGMKREDFEFLQTLVTLAQNAYENAVMFEREHERTLGIVKTLISLIEENTLLKGTSEFVSRYVGIVAKDVGYPEEGFKDLIYGTVLRDMGMIKVSDLILRSPRDLTKDEWEIIKRHPEDGAEMLSRMKFSRRVVEIVRSHHERFNGEGYPMSLVGKEMPLGARIISVVESYAAMIHERPNRPALSEREALDTLKENYGLRYDREIVHHFARIMEKEIAKSVRPGVKVS